jgi:hypothetical protein
MSGLMAEDGAEFFGRVEPLEDGRFRVSCYARIDRKDSEGREEPKTRLFRSANEGEDWISYQAQRRGFAKYHLLPA